MATDDSTEEADALQVIDGVANILMVVSDVAAGDYAIRLPEQYGTESPLGALHAGINEMIASLEQEEQRSTAYREELEEKLATIELQRAAIRELSTPIMEVWRGVLCLPIIGVMDSERSAEMTQTLLMAVVAKRASYIIVDITGIEMMDTATVDHFIRMARSVHFLGAECVLTGVNPTIAMTIVQMGVELGDVTSFRSLRAALEHYVRTSLVSKDRRQRKTFETSA
jgi:rsbT co-antagonist protein RsbR